MRTMTSKAIQEGCPGLLVCLSPMKEGAYLKVLITRIKHLVTPSMLTLARRWKVYFLKFKKKGTREAQEADTLGLKWVRTGD